MNEAKQNLFEHLQKPFPAPHLMKNAERRISWSVGLFISRADRQTQDILKPIGNTALASEYVKWFKENYVGTTSK